MREIKIILIIVCISFGSNLLAQDPHFSQTYSNKLYLSPSFTGATKEYRVSAIYRNQWPRFGNQMATTAAAFDYNLSKFNSGIGVHVMHDVLGTSRYSNSSVGVYYSYNIKLNRKLYFRPGIALKYGQTNIDLSSLYYSSNLELGQNFIPDLAIDGDKKNIFDGTVSGLLLHQRFWIGATIDHLFRPNLSFSSIEDRLPIKTTVFIGYKFQKSQRLISATKQEFSISATYRNQGISDQLDIGIHST